jgi:hypothetical protein
MEPDTAGSRPTLKGKRQARLSRSTSDRRASARSLCLFPATQQIERKQAFWHWPNSSQRLVSEGISQLKRESVCRTRSRAARHCSETCDDQIYASWDGRDSIHDGRNTGIRTGSYPGIGRMSLSSQAPGAVAGGRGAANIRARALSTQPLPAGCETSTKPWSAPVGHRQPRQPMFPRRRLSGRLSIRRTRTLTG